MGKKTIILSSLLVLVILTSSLYFIFDKDFKVDIQNTRTKYYVDLNGSWELSATEYVHLYDGTTKMRAKSRNLIWYNDSDFAYAVRTSIWKDNIKTIQTYKFKIDESNIENVPIGNNFTCINCDSKIVHYEIRDILYDGETKNIESPFSFGNNMNIEWQEDNDFSWAKVYQQKVASDKIVIRYKPDSNYEEYSVRLFDPIQDWWDYDWTYKKPINIYLTGNPTPTDYQVKLNVTYDSDMNNDFSDLRFTDENDTNEIPYWKENVSDGEWAIVWIKVPNSINTTNRILAYMYYGNSEATDTSNGENTFEFFDDFDDEDINTTKWNVNQDSPNESLGLMILDNDDDITGKVLFGYNHSFEALAKADEQDSLFVGGYNDSSNLVELFNDDNLDGEGDYDSLTLGGSRGGSVTFTSIDNLIDIRNYYLIYRLDRLQNAYVSAYQDGTLFYDTYTDTPLLDTAIWHSAYDSTQESTLYLNWTRVRKNNNATISYSFGDEEEGTIIISLNSPEDNELIIFINEVTTFNITAEFTNLSGLPYNISLLNNLSGSWGVTNTTQLFTIYDEINDSSVNWSLWSNTTGGSCGGGTCTKGFEENSDTLRIYATALSAGTADAEATLNSTGLNHSNIGQLIFKSNSSTVRPDSGGSAYTQIFVFGNEIHSTSGDGQSDDSIWKLVRNSSCGVDCFDVYDDYVYQESINATDNNLSFNVYARDASSNQNHIAMLWLSYVYYTLKETQTFDLTVDNSIIWGARACYENGHCQNSFYNYTLNIERKVPQINITYPENTSYTSTPPTQLNYTVNGTWDNLDKCWYSNDSGSTNYSIQTAGDNFTIVSSPGSNTLIVYCNDTFGTEAKNKTVFYIYDMNFTINGVTEDLSIELGSNVTLNASINLNNVSFDIDHPEYGDNQNNSALTSTLNLIINYFRKTLFPNENLNQILYYNETNETNNQSTFNISNLTIDVHQYDYVNNLSINISGDLNEGNSTIYEPQLVFYAANNTSKIDRVFYGDLVGSNIQVDKVFDNSNGSNLYLNSTNISFENYGDQLIYLYLDDNADVQSFLLNISGHEYGFNFTENFSGTSYKDNVLSNTTHFISYELPSGSNPQEFLIDNFSDSSINTTLWFVPADYSYDGGSEDWSESRTKSEDSSGLDLSSSLTQDFDEDEGDTSTIEHYLIVNDTSYLDLLSNNYFVFNFSFSSSSHERVYSYQCTPYVKVEAGDTKVWESDNVFTCVDPDGSCSFTTEGDIIVNISKNYTSEQFNYEVSGVETYYTSEFGGCGSKTYTKNWTNGSWSVDYSSCTDSNGEMNNSGSFTPSDITNPINIYSSITGSGDRYASGQDACVGDGTGPCALYLSGKCIAWYTCGYFTSESSCNSYSPDTGSCTWQDSGQNYEGCEAISQTVTIYNSSQELNYVKNSSYYSLSVFDSSADVNSIDADADWNGLASFYLSTDNGDNYQSANFSDYTNTILNSGKNVKYYANLIVQGGGYLTNIPYLDNVNLQTERGFPENISLDFGNDGTYDSITYGELNTTNGSIRVNLTSSDITNAFTGSPDVGDHMWLVPLRVFSATRGLVKIDAINLTYNPNPIYLGVSYILDSLKELVNEDILNISVGSINGTINFTGLQYDYLGGNKTYKIVAHSNDGIMNDSINLTYYFSRWDYEWIPENVEWIYFQPKSPDSKNVTPYGQDNETPLINFTNLGYGGKNATLSALINSTLDCVNTTLSLTNNKSDGIILNSSFQDISNLSYLETVNFSFWADYDCSYSQYYLYQPHLYLRLCANDTVCSTEVV